jgi:hypothetical protein
MQLEIIEKLWVYTLMQFVVSIEKLAGMRNAHASK